MASSLHLPCSSSLTVSLQKSHNQLNNSNNNNNNNHLSLYSSLSSFSSLSHSHSHSPRPIATKRTTINHFVLHFSATTQQDPVVNTPETAQEPQQQQEEFSTTRLIAQNVPWSSTAEDIRSLFEMHGTVLEVELSMYNKTMNRGLAFVEMGSPEEALAVLSDLQSYEFEGRTLRLNYAKPKKKKPSPAKQSTPGLKFNLFVANLSYKARANDLREFFRSEGSDVLSAEVIFQDNPRRSSGYGFVSFKTKKEADAALSAFEGKEFMGRPLRVARSKQFVKQRTEEDLQSNSTLPELNSSAEQPDAVDEN